MGKADSLDGVRPNRNMPAVRYSRRGEGWKTQLQASSFLSHHLVVTFIRSQGFRHLDAIDEGTATAHAIIHHRRRTVPAWSLARFVASMSGILTGTSISQHYYGGTQA